MKHYPRVFHPPSQTFFLFGPRGTGKSTLMRRLYPNALWVDLLHPDNERTYLAWPERLFQLVEGVAEGSIVILDEIQKVPLLLSVVHAMIEQKREIKFILTGSSARKLKRTGADLLAGRALNCVLHPFMAYEQGEDFRLERALREGMLPLLTDLSEPDLALSSYVRLYLQEEIQGEGLVRRIEGFARFLEVVSFSHASLLNLANISRECAVKRKTVENYLQILEDLLLCHTVQLFTRRARRELSSHPKFYLFDAGVYCALRRRGPLDTNEEIEGAALEGLVAQHLIAWRDYSRPLHEITFWRTRSGVEVDFIVYGPLGFWAIEVKNGSKVHPADIRSLHLFLQDYPEAKAILLYRGKERLQQGSVLCIPCEEFFLGLRPNSPLET